MNNTDAATILYKYILKDAEETMKANKEVSIETLPLETMKENAFFKMHIAAMEEYAEQFKAEQKQSAGVWVRASERLPEMEKVIFIKDNIGLKLLGNFYYNDEDGYWIFIQPNGAHDSYEINQDKEGFGDYAWLDETPQKQLSDEEIEGIMLERHPDFIHLDGAQYRIVKNTYIKGYKAALNLKNK